MLALEAGCASSFQMMVATSFADNKSTRIGVIFHLLVAFNLIGTSSPQSLIISAFLVQQLYGMTVSYTSA
jgi:hypothetical protein